MPGGDRIVRINELIRHELGTLIGREVEFAQGILVTVTDVATSPDLEHSKVYVSVMPSSERDAAFATLNASVRTLQRLLNRRLKTKPVPKLRFLIDDAVDRSSRVERLLDTLHDGE